MKELFNYILSNYLTEKKNSSRGNELAKYIRQRPYYILNQEAYIDKKTYLIDSSPGKGNWAEIPWIAVFDRDITTTATYGY